IAAVTLAPKTVKSRKRTALCRKPVDCRVRRKLLARAIGAPLELDRARGKPFGADQDLPGDTDQVGRGEFGTGPLIEVVVEHVEAPRRERAVEMLAGRIGRAVSLLQVEDDRLERGDRL